MSHLKEANNCITDVSSAYQTWEKRSLISSHFCNNDQCRRQCVPLNKTYKRDLSRHLLKTISFLTSYKVQQMAAPPVNNNVLFDLSLCLCQLWKISITFKRGLRPKTRCIVRHKELSIPIQKHELGLVWIMWSNFRLLELFRF